jgi:hypothetical protein
MMFFEIFFHRVAKGGARWDPIALPAKEHIGISSYLTHPDSDRIR